MIRQLTFLVLIFLCSCDQTKPTDYESCIRSMAKANLSLFKGSRIDQIYRCMINIESINGVEGIFSGAPTVDEITKKFGEASLYKLVSFCKTNNIYSFRSVGNGFLIKTNNCYFTFDELKKRDSEFYDNTFKYSDLSHEEIRNAKPGLCFFIGQNDSIINTLSKDWKIYSFNDSVVYFWDCTPGLLLDCVNGLIH